MIPLNRPFGYSILRHRNQDAVTRKVYKIYPAMINDLERNIKSNIKLFPDETMLFSVPEITTLMPFVSGRINGN